MKIVNSIVLFMVEMTKCNKVWDISNLYMYEEEGLLEFVLFFAFGFCLVKVTITKSKNKTFSTQ